jgi:hypothetical protein
MLQVNRKESKLRFKNEVYEELAQDKDDELAEIENRKYQEYLANHWINQICKID